MANFDDQTVALGSRETLSRDDKGVGVWRKVGKAVVAAAVRLSFFLDGAVTTTWACETTAPVGSFTTPCKPPVVSCANAPDTNSARTNTAVKMPNSTRIFVMNLPPKGTVPTKTG